MLSHCTTTENTWASEKNKNTTILGIFDLMDDSCLTLSFLSSLLLQDFSNDDTKLEYNVDADNGIAMEGYLFKRASNAFKTWNR